MNLIDKNLYLQFALNMKPKFEDLVVVVVDFFVGRFVEKC